MRINNIGKVDKNTIEAKCQWIKKISNMIKIGGIHISKLVVSNACWMEKGVWILIIVDNILIEMQTEAFSHLIMHSF